MKIKLEAEYIDSARGVALQAMLAYSLDRAVSAHPDYQDPSKITEASQRVIAEHSIGQWKKEIKDQFARYEAFIRGGKFDATETHTSDVEDGVDVPAAKTVVEQSKTQAAAAAPAAPVVTEDAFTRMLRNHFEGAGKQFQAGPTIFMAGGFGTGKTTFEQLLAGEGKLESQDSRDLRQLFAGADRTATSQYVLDNLDKLEGDKAVGYSEKDRRNTFWKVRALMAGCNAAFDVLRSDLGIKHVRAGSMTPSVDDEDAVAYASWEVTRAAEKGQVVVVGNYVNDPAVAVARAMAREGNRLSKDEIVNSQNGFVGFFGEMEKHADACYLFNHHQEKGKEPTLVAKKDKRGAELEPVDGKEYQQFQQLQAASLASRQRSEVSRGL